MHKFEYIKYELCKFKFSSKLSHDLMNLINHAIKNALILTQQNFASFILTQVISNWKYWVIDLTVAN